MGYKSTIPQWTKFSHMHQITKEAENKEKWVCTYMCMHISANSITCVESKRNIAEFKFLHIMECNAFIFLQINSSIYIYLNSFAKNNLYENYIYIYIENWIAVCIEWSKRYTILTVTCNIYINMEIRLLQFWISTKRSSQFPLISLPQKR